MFDHLTHEQTEAIELNEKLTFTVQQSSKSRFSGKLRYWWCLLAAGALLLFVATPTLIFLWIIDQRLWFYPLALSGAET